MKIIKHIFDGDYGCEECTAQAHTVSVTLVDDLGNESYVTVEDSWLTNRGLKTGDIWPED